MGDNNQGTGLWEGAELDGIEEEERTNWRYAMILTFLIYTEMLHLPEPCSLIYITQTSRTITSCLTQTSPPPTDPTEYTVHRATVSSYL